MLNKDKIDIFTEYKKLQLRVWEYPHVLFSFSAILVAVLAYFIASEFFLQERYAILFVIVTMVVLLFIIGLFIIAIFNKIIMVKRREMEFISIAAHHLRSPITSLSWALESLQARAKEKSDYAEETLILQNMHMALSRANQAVNMLLELGRIEKGVMIFNKESISLSDIIEKVLIDFRVIAQEKHIKIQFDPPSKLPNVFIDEIRVAIVVQNLLENAIFYTERPSEILVKIKNEENGFLKCVIRDQGIGIPLNQQEFIFEKYFRADNAKKKYSRGTGIGLYITKTIVELLGGQIGLSSTLDKGSIFWFTLPVTLK